MLDCELFLAILVDAIFKSVNDWIALSKVEVLALLKHGCKQTDVEQSLVMHPGLTAIYFSAVVDVEQQDEVSVGT